VRGDIEGATAMYTEADRLEPSAEVKRRLAALEEKAAYLRLPAEYRALPDQPSIMRGDLAALIGIRLEGVLARATAQPVLVTDTRNHWAAVWIMTVVSAGIMDAFENHTFQPRTAIHRSDLAQSVSRLLKLIALNDPALLKQWQGRQAKMADVGVSNVNYADASLSVSAGILPLAPGDLFQLTRPVSGDEAIAAISKLEQLFNTTK